MQSSQVETPDDNHLCPNGAEGAVFQRLSKEEEAVAVALRQHPPFPLGDCLYNYNLQAAIPHLTRSSLYRRFQRHGMPRQPELEGDKPARKTFHGLSKGTSDQLLSGPTQCHRAGNHT